MTTDTKSTAGRPAVDETDLAKTRTVKMTDELWAKAGEMAEARGLSIAALVRSLLSDLASQDNYVQRTADNLSRPPVVPGAGADQSE